MADMPVDVIHGLCDQILRRINLRHFIQQVQQSGDGGNAVGWHTGGEPFENRIPRWVIQNNVDGFAVVERQRLFSPGHAVHLCFSLTY